MRNRRFGRTNWQVSEIGYGMWGMAGWTGSSDEESLASLDRAVRVRRLDAAPADFAIYDPADARSIRRFLESVQIKAPASVWNELHYDAATRNGNRVVRIREDGTMSELLTW